MSEKEQKCKCAKVVHFDEEEFLYTMKGWEFDVEGLKFKEEFEPQINADAHRLGKE